MRTSLVLFFTLFSILAISQQVSGLYVTENHETLLFINANEIEFSLFEFSGSQAINVIGMGNFIVRNGKLKIETDNYLKKLESSYRIVSQKNLLGKTMAIIHVCDFITLAPLQYVGAWYMSERESPVGANPDSEGFVKLTIPAFPWDSILRVGSIGYSIVQIPISFGKETEYQVFLRDVEHVRKMESKRIIYRLNQQGDTIYIKEKGRNTLVRKFIKSN